MEWNNRSVWHCLVCVRRPTSVWNIRTNTWWRSLHTAAFTCACQVAERGHGTSRVCTSAHFFLLFFLSHCRLSNVASRRGVRLYITFIAVSMLPAVCLWRQTLCLAEAFNTERLGWSLRGSVLMPVYVFVSIHDRPSLNMYVCVFLIHKLLDWRQHWPWLRWNVCEESVHACVKGLFSFLLFCLKVLMMPRFLLFAVKEHVEFSLQICFPTLQWLHGTRILQIFLFLFFCFSIFCIHMEMGGRWGTESHINLIGPWIAASVFGLTQRWLKGTAQPPLSDRRAEHIFSCDAHVFVHTHTRASTKDEKADAHNCTHTISYTRALGKTERCLILCQCLCFTHIQTATPNPRETLVLQYARLFFLPFSQILFSLFY